MPLDLRAASHDARGQDRVSSGAHWDAAQAGAEGEATDSRQFALPCWRGRLGVGVIAESAKTAAMYIFPPSIAVPMPTWRKCWPRMFARCSGDVIHQASAALTASSNGGPPSQ